jgi:gluconolactonase
MKEGCSAMSTIEVISPALRRVVDMGTELERLGDGFVAGEGPVWVASEQCLLFSDYRASKRYRWTQSRGVSLVADDTGEGNGQTLDERGRLYVCERATQRVVRYPPGSDHAPDKDREVIADTWNGARMNAPNDVIVAADGTVIFTDPISPDYESERGYPGVFRVAPGEREPTLLTQEIQFPNGLALSPDESTLYVNDSKRQAVYTVAAGPGAPLPDPYPALFFKFDTAKGSGVPDGMKIDVEGNVYSTGPGGVWIIDPAGEPLGFLSTGSHHHTNLAWGGRDWLTLFITTRESLSRIALKIPGMPVPARRIRT